MILITTNVSEQLKLFRLAVLVLHQHIAQGDLGLEQLVTEVALLL